MLTVSELILKDDAHADVWREHVAFLDTPPEGAAYTGALLVELDAFRETLRKWQAEALAKTNRH